MHGLDKTTNLSFLIDKELTQLALGRYEFQLKFVGEVSISVQCDLKFEHNGNAYMIESENIAQTKELACLVGRTISKFEIKNDGELALFFTGDYNISLFDSSKDFESYVIWNNGDFISV